MGVPSSPNRAAVAKRDCALAQATAEPPKQWWEVQDFVLQVCTFAGGPRAALELAGASKAFHKIVVGAWAELTRRFPHRLYVVGGLDSAFKPVSSAWRYDASQDSWEVLPSIASPVAGPTAVISQGHLYVFGGEFCGDAVHEAQRFDPGLGRWEPVAPMLEGRIRAAGVACGGYVYAFGGLDGIKATSSAERYDPRTNTWEALPPMNRPRYACTSAALPEGGIVVFGGELTDAGCTASVERYDPETRTWELLPPVRNPACGGAIALTGLGEMVFAVGGLGLSGQALAMAEKLRVGRALAVEASTFTPPNWVPMPPMKTPRHLASVAGFGGGAVVVGGKGPAFEAIDCVEWYDPDENSWEELQALPSPRLRAAVAGGRL